MITINGNSGETNVESIDLLQILIFAKRKCKENIELFESLEQDDSEFLKLNRKEMSICEKLIEIL